MAATQQNGRQDNVIFVGSKPPMDYILPIVTQFNGGSPEVVLKARGRAISNAVDVTEICRNKFVQGATVTSVQIGTEKVTADSGKKFNVSFIEIHLAKQP